ncbi:MAG TPA: hypothetical protein VKE88_00400 [Candidatus Nanoarchaeia archaeon]|nr:hypothetical protein [Candidatus Nanoarchaeia archaeon]
MELNTYTKKVQKDEGFTLVKKSPRSVAPIAIDIIVRRIYESQVGIELIKDGKVQKLDLPTDYGKYLISEETGLVQVHKGVFVKMTKVSPVSHRARLRVEFDSEKYTILTSEYS